MLDENLYNVLPACYSFAGAVNQLLREPQKPKLVMEVKKQETTVGGTAVLELKVEGFPKPDIKW